MGLIEWLFGTKTAKRTGDRGRAHSMWSGGYDWDSREILASNPGGGESHGTTHGATHGHHAGHAHPTTHPADFGGSHSHGGAHDAGGFSGDHGGGGFDGGGGHH